jgi:hypothetical protein
LKGAPHENVTRNFPTADIQPNPMDRLNREILSKGREGEEGVTRKGRPTDFLFLLHLILGIPPALFALSMDFASVL